MAGLIIIIPLGLVAKNNNEQSEIVSRRGTTIQYGERIQSNINTIQTNSLLVSLAFSVGTVTFEEFNILTDPIINPKIQAIGYLEEIPNDDRLAFELESSINYNRTLVITDFGGIPSPIRPMYTPVSYGNPIEGNEAGILFDISSNPVRNESLTNARVTNMPTVSDGITLVQETSDQTGVLMFHPIPVKNFISTVIRVQTLLLESLSDFDTISSLVTIHNVRNDEGIGSVISTQSWQVSDRVASDYRFNVTIADNIWEVRVDYLILLESSTWYLYFAIGIPIVVLLAFAVFLFTWLIERRIMLETSNVKNNARQQYVHYVFHEIRIPLQNIKISLLNLEYVLTDDDNLETLEAALSAVDHTSQILNDTLDIGKMESGKFSIEKSYFSISICNLLLETFNQGFEAKGIEFKHNIHKDLYTHNILADPIRFTQCLNNLLSNALKYTLEGTVEFTISIIDRVVFGDNRLWTIEIKVSDTGVGIAAEDLPKLFRPYVRIHNNTSEIGTGLGLTITKNIINAHNGQIMAESKPNVGTTFTITIPVEVIERPVMEPLNVSSEIPEKVFTASVLIVDDNKHNCHGMGTFMKNMGFTDIAYAYNGVEALQKLEEHKYDIIFMDFNMPIMDGLECIIEIRNRFDNNFIVMLTGAHLNNMDISNVNTIMQKPFQIDRLKKTLIEFGDTMN